MISDEKARKWVGIGLLAFAAIQIYFVQEMLVALVLFTGAFAILATVGLALYLVDRAGQWSLEWAGDHARPALQLAQRGWALVEDLSKKQFRHPRSMPVRQSR
jgi:hypothetical protein